MIGDGYAFAYGKYPHSRMDHYRSAEGTARESSRGLWGPDPLPAEPPAVVYVTKSGSKFHAEGCRYLRAGATPLLRDQAAEGRTACKVCRPGE